MSDTPTEGPAHDDLVELAVERAASKVADAATTAIATVPSHDAMLNRTSSLLAIAIIVILAVFNLFLNIQTKNEVVRNQEKVEAACKIAALSAGAQEAPTGALRLAECLK